MTVRMGDYSRGKCACGSQAKLSYAPTLERHLCADCMAVEYERVLKGIRDVLGIGACTYLPIERMEGHDRK